MKQIADSLKWDLENDLIMAYLDSGDCKSALLKKLHHLKKNYKNCKYFDENEDFTYTLEHIYDEFDKEINADKYYGKKYFDLAQEFFVNFALKHSKHEKKY